MEQSRYKILEILSILEKPLGSINDEWYIIGGSSLILNDLENVPSNDIDIMVSKTSSDFLKKELNMHILPSLHQKASRLFRSDLSTFLIKGISLDIIGDLHIKSNGTWEKLVIEEYIELQIAKLTVRTPTLKDNERILRLFGRKKDIQRIKLIKEFSNKRSHKFIE